MSSQDEYDNQPYLSDASEKALESPQATRKRSRSTKNVSTMTLEELRDFVSKRQAAAVKYKSKKCPVVQAAENELIRIKGRLNKALYLKREVLRRVKISLYKLNILSLESLEASYFGVVDKRPSERLFVFVVMYIKKLLEVAEKNVETNFDNAKGIFYDIFPLLIRNVEFDTLALSEIEYEDYLAFSTESKKSREEFNIIKDAVFFYTVTETAPYIMINE